MLNGTGRNPSELLPAVTTMIAKVAEIENEIVLREDSQWISEHGPRLRRIEDANIIYLRDSESVRVHTRLPRGDGFRYQDAADAYLQLAATCVKISIDYASQESGLTGALRRLMRDDVEIVPIQPDETDETEDE